MITFPGWPGGKGWDFRLTEGFANLRSRLILPEQKVGQHCQDASEADARGDQQGEEFVVVCDLRNRRWDLDPVLQYSAPASPTVPWLTPAAYA